ncbi:hypothetical protein Tco_0753111 [Tanacetum coccineum]
MVVFVFGLSGLFVAGFAALVMANDVEAWKLKSNAVLITVLYMDRYSYGVFNILVGMDLWNPSAGIRNMKMQPNQTVATPMQADQWVQDERELKRQVASYKLISK